MTICYDVKPSPKGSEKISVIFDIDVNDLIKLEATNSKTGLIIEGRTVFNHDYPEPTENFSFKLSGELPERKTEYQIPEE